ncbi:MAG TPA: hypothetical protein VJT84_12165 [Gaiellaceae bacterium]|nr:hypothetical protein [Gaiellaceae bacterium]
MQPAADASKPAAARPADTGDDAVAEPLLPIEPEVEIVATARDAVSYRAFVVLYDRMEAERRQGLLSPRTRPFVIKLVGRDEPIAEFHSWPEVRAWHDRHLISTGWRVLHPVPGLE